MKTFKHGTEDQNPQYLTASEVIRMQERYQHTDWMEAATAMWQRTQEYRREQEAQMAELRHLYHRLAGQWRETHENF